MVRSQQVQRPEHGHANMTPIRNSALCFPCCTAYGSIFFEKRSCMCSYWVSSIGIVHLVV